MKKLMILGAGIYQVPLIQKAKCMGIETIVVSIQGNYPGFEYADKIYYEDTKNYPKILEIARKEKIDGIVTTGTDVAVVTIGKICDELNLAGLSFEAGKIATDKMLMKEKYEEYDVRTARFRKVYFHADDIEEKVRELSFPIMFKAVDTSGSRGIIKVNKPEEISAAYETVKENTQKNYFIIEEFLEGKEFGAQAFVYKGEVKFILPHGDYVFQGDTGVPIGHWAPYELEEEIVEDAKEQLVKAVKAMGLDNCALNADFILVDGETYVLEIGGRAGATCLAELVSLYYGYDYYEKIILAALGEKVDFESQQSNPNVGMLLRSEKDGIIKEIINRNSQQDEDIVEVQFDYNVGDRVHAFRVGPHRIGHVIVKADTVRKAQEKIEKVLEKIEVVVE